MPRRKKPSLKTLSQDSKGRFLRNLGWVRSPTTGKVSQRKFYLGHDETEAKLASARLEVLWQCVERRFARQQREQMILEAVLPDEYGREFERVGNIIQPKPPATHAMWCPISLVIAEAIRNGQPVARVSSGSVPKPRVPSRIKNWLFELRQDFNVIHIELDDDQLASKVNADLRKEGEQLKEKSAALLAAPRSSQNLHQAIEVYKTFTKRDYVDTDGETSEWAKAKIRQIDFVKRNSLDLDLVQIGEKSVASILDILCKRPVTQRGKHCSKSFARSCMKELNAFLKWLDKSDQFFWTWPVGYECKPGRVVETPEQFDETAKPKRRLIETNTIPELETLYEYARPIQRVYMLLGLNCGFIAAEQADLRLNEIYLDKAHPERVALDLPEDRIGNWISRFRGKTEVFGTWSLWPETVQAIHWWTAERQRIKDAICGGNPTAEESFERQAKGRLLITQNGKPLAEKNRRTGRIPGSWNALLKSVVDKNADFNRLSIKYLRKTGSSLVRRVSSGEIASIFLAHGKPHNNDRDLEVYANRPFAQLFDALDEVHDMLQSLWRAVPEPFAEPRKLGGKSNLTPSKIKKIKRLSINGKTAAEISDELSIHLSTVHRHIPDFLKKKRAKRGSSKNQAVAKKQKPPSSQSHQ